MSAGLSARNMLRVFTFNLGRTGTPVRNGVAEAKLHFMGAASIFSRHECVGFTVFDNRSDARQQPMGTGHYQLFGNRLLENSLPGLDCHGAILVEGYLPIRISYEQGRKEADVRRQ